MGKPKKIMIEYISGDVDGIAILHDNLSVVTAYVIPGKKYREALTISKEKFKELTNPGIYYLVSTIQKGSPVYIGQTRNGIARLADHLAKKDYWTKAIMFLAPIKRFSLDVIEGLEQDAITEAKTVAYYDVQTKVKGKLAMDKNDFDGFYADIEFYMTMLGYKVSGEKNNNIDVQTCISTIGKLHLSSDKVHATGNVTEAGFVVYKASSIAEKNRPSCGDSVKKKRKKIFDSGNIKNGVLTKDILFKSPSAAAACLTGGETNGLIAWKDVNGKTLKEIMK